MKNCFLILCSLLLLTACDNDVEINAPEKEIPVVYGFLDQHDTFQYIRIEKVFQTIGQTTPEETARLKNTASFGMDSVTVTKLSSGQSFRFVKTNAFVKNDGLFNSADNDLYTDSGRMGGGTSSLGAFSWPDETFELTLYSAATGKTYKARTHLVHDAYIPAISSLYLGLYTKSGTLRLLTLNSGIRTGRNAALYDIVLRVFYNETNTSLVTTTKHFDYPLMKNFVPDSRNGNDKFASSAYRMLDFLNYLKENMPADPTVERDYLRTELVVYGGNGDMQDYYDLFKPSSSFTQKRSDYSNIPGALGIFASRNQTSKAYTVGPPANQVGADSTGWYISRWAPNFKDIY